MLTRKERDIAAHLQTASWGDGSFRGWYYRPDGGVKRFRTNTSGEGLWEGNPVEERQICDLTQFRAHSTPAFRLKLLRILARTPPDEGQ